MRDYWALNHQNVKFLETVDEFWICIPSEPKTWHFAFFVQKHGFIFLRENMVFVPKNLVFDNIYA